MIYIILHFPHILNLILEFICRSFGHNDGKDGEEHDLFCGPFAGGLDEFWSLSTGDSKP